MRKSAGWRDNGLAEIFVVTNIFLDIQMPNDRRRNVGLAIKCCVFKCSLIIF